MVGGGRGRVVGEAARALCEGRLALRVQDGRVVNVPCEDKALSEPALG